jgi:acyl carrier protein
MGHQQREDQIRWFLLFAIRSIEPALADALRSNDLAFTAIGMDSIQAAELSCAIADTYNVAVPATVAFDHPTIDRLTTYLVSVLAAAPVRARRIPRGGLSVPRTAERQRGAGSR